MIAQLKKLIFIGAIYRALLILVIVAAVIFIAANGLDLSLNLSIGGVSNHGK